MIAAALVELCVLVLAPVAIPLPQGQKPSASPQVEVPAGHERPSTGRLGLPTEEGTGWPAIGTESLPRTQSPEVVVPSLARPGSERPVPAMPAAPAGEIAPSRGIAAGLPPASAFRSLGGIAIWWRLTVFGPQGESMATREFAQRLDASVSDRDRLEFPDGRVYGRLGPAVFAQRNRMPWLTLVEPATHELDLFGQHARLPYGLADGQRWLAVGNRREQHGSETWEVACFEGRPASGAETVGPSVDPAPKVDRFELCSPAAGGLPREFRIVLAAAGQARRVRLEDWRDVAGVPIPFRRIYVDETGRPTTQLEVLRFEPGAAATDRDFRLD